MSAYDDAARRAASPPPEPHTITVEKIITYRCGGRFLTVGDIQRFANTLTSHMVPAQIRVILREGEPAILMATYEDGDS